MKTIFDIRAIVPLAAVMVLAVACGGGGGYEPTDSPNPWADNYASVATPDSMDFWAAYNVHDPCVRKFGDTYYCYSTDAAWIPPRPPKADGEKPPKPPRHKFGNIPMRTSKDLVNWEFKGYAFDSIPTEAWEYVHPISGRKTSRGLWAPFVYKEGDTFRMYYCLSTFGEKVSYIGLAEAANPLGPWTPKGCVVKTDSASVMNAIDPTIIENHENGQLWMIYGSFFGGLFAVELNRQTGLTLTDGDQGHLIAHRANYQVDNMEAPEVIYNPDTKKYYLFVSYGPLATTYNVRVAVADRPEGPYTDYLGVDPRGEVNTFPVLTAPYRFENHGGWQGMAHCTCFDDGQGNYYLASQGRPQNEPGMMDLCIRRMDFRADGWPMVSPERYAGEKQATLSLKDLYGKYEIIHVKDNYVEKELSGGQSNVLLPEETNTSEKIELSSANISDFKDGVFSLTLQSSKIDGVKSYIGHDWENQKTTILFSGIDNQGFAIWGKKIN